MSKNNENYFCWSDAWVFTALYYSNKDKTKINLSKLIAAGDVLNHAIFTKDEIKNAFIKLQRTGIIIIYSEIIEFTDDGLKLMEKIEKVRGGLFSRIDISLQKLNSRRNKFPFFDDVNNCDFITDEMMDESYKIYKKYFM